MKLFRKEKAENFNANFFVIPIKYKEQSNLRIYDGKLPDGREIKYVYQNSSLLFFETLENAVKYYQNYGMVYEECIIHQIIPNKTYFLKKNFILEEVK